VDKETWKKLIIFREYELIIENRLNVKLIQEILNVAGFKTGSVDGKYGPQTNQAVRDFQKNYALKIDGKIGYKTLKKMSEFLVFEE